MPMPMLSLPDWLYEWLTHLDNRLDTLNRKLDKLLQGQRQSEESDMAEREEIENLVQQVQANRDVTESAALALQGLAQQVSDLTEELQAAISNNPDVAPDIQAAADALRANTEALRQAIPTLAAAVAKNTEQKAA